MTFWKTLSTNQIQPHENDLHSRSNAPFFGSELRYYILAENKVGYYLLRIFISILFVE